MGLLVLLARTYIAIGVLIGLVGFSIYEIENKESFWERLFSFVVFISCGIFLWPDILYKRYWRKQVENAEDRDNDE